MNKLKLSVFIPNYNHGHYLSECLDFLLEQSYQPAEIIVLDDSSTDNSMEVLSSYIGDNKQIIVAQNEKNMGVNYTINKLLEMCTGDFVFGLAADDKILQGFLEKTMHLIEKNPSCAFCSSLTRVMNEKGRDKGVFPSSVVSDVPVFFSPEKSLELMKKYGSWVKGNTVVYRRHALLELGGLHSSLGPFSDGFLHQILPLKYGACFVPEPLACLRETTENYSVLKMSSVNEASEIALLAKTMMKTKYCEFFPADYVEEWERRYNWSMRVSLWYTIRRAQETYTDMMDAEQKQCPKMTYNLMARIMKLSINFQALLVMLFWGMRGKLLTGYLFRRWCVRAKSRNYPLQVL